MKLYGWIEQHGFYGIYEITHDVDVTDGDVIDADGRVFASELREGQWFTSFRAAKRAAVNHWNDMRKTSRRAIAAIRAQHKPVTSHD